MRSSDLWMCGGNLFCRSSSGVIRSAPKLLSESGASAPAGSDRRTCEATGKKLDPRPVRRHLSPVVTLMTRETVSVLAVSPPHDVESMLPNACEVDIDRVQNAAQAIVRLIRKPYHLILIEHTAGGEVT